MPKLSMLATVFFAIGLAVVLWLFVHAIRKVLGAKLRALVSSRRSRVIRLIVLVFGVGFILVSQLLFWISSGMVGFRPVSEDESIAVIEFRHSDGGAPIMSIAARSLDSDQIINTVVIMRSEAVAVEVEALSFPEWLRVVDMTDCYRVSSVRFIGEFVISGDDPGEQRIQEGVESLWRFFEAAGKLLPTIKASRILSDPIYFVPGTQLEVFATDLRITLSQR